MRAIPRPVPSGIPDGIGPSSANQVCALRALHDGALLQVIHWRCLHDGPTLRSTRAFAGHVLTVPLGGASRLLHEKGELFSDPSQIQFHSPGVPYSTRHPMGTGDHGCHFAFADGVVEEALDQPRGKTARAHAAGCRRPGPPRSSPLPTSRLVDVRLLDHLATTAGQPLDPLLAEELGLRLLDLALGGPGHAEEERSSRASTRALHRKLVDRTRQLLHDPAARTWSLARIGREVASSPFHLARIFRLHTGRSIHEYRCRLRLVEAIDAILADPDRRLDEIALEAGFSSHGHLCSDFARQVGSPPSSLRSAPLRLLRDSLASH